MKIEKSKFGITKNGEKVDVFTLSNDGGFEAKILTYGATIQGLSLDGREVCLGYDTLREYEENSGYFGATVGRVANRIKDAKYEIDGNQYTCSKNDGENSLHGGIVGFSKRVFEAKTDDAGLHLSIVSADCDEGYPGELKFVVTYTVTNDNRLVMHYEATTTKPTPITITNHSYFNLSDEPDILGHTLKLNSEAYFKNDKGGVAQEDKLTSVLDGQEETFNFRHAKTVGEDINDENEQLAWAGGYDHCFKIASDNALEPYAVLVYGDLELKCYTSMKYFHFYSGNYVDQKGKGGVHLGKRAGLALEAEMLPDAINSKNENTKEAAILRPEETYDEYIVFELVKN